MNSTCPPVPPALGRGAVECKLHLYVPHEWEIAHRYSQQLCYFLSIDNTFQQVLFMCVCVCVCVCERVVDILSSLAGHVLVSLA